MNMTVLKHYYVVADVLVETIPPTNSTYIFDYTTKQWQDTSTLQDLKLAKLAYLKTARDSAINGTITWDNSTFDSDQVSQTRLMGVYLDALSNPTLSQAWRLSDNTWQVLSANDIKAIWAVLKAHLTTQFIKFATYEALVESATTIAQVEAVTWS